MHAREECNRREEEELRAQRQERELHDFQLAHGVQIQSPENAADEQGPFANWHSGERAERWIPLMEREVVR